MSFLRYTVLAVLPFVSCAAPSAIAPVEQPLRTTTQVRYYHGTVGAGPTLITREDGTVHDERRYEPFGAGLDALEELPGGGSQAGPVDYGRDPHNVLNKESDVATGWSDHGARWMAPETSRWLTPDPPVKAPDPKFMAAPWSLHPYQYADQNPVTFWDPDGREPCPKSQCHRYSAVRPLDSPPPSSSRHALRPLGSSSSWSPFDWGDAKKVAGWLGDGMKLTAEAGSAALGVVGGLWGAGATVKAIAPSAGLAKAMAEFQDIKELMDFRNEPAIQEMIRCPRGRCADIASKAADRGFGVPWLISDKGTEPLHYWDGDRGYKWHSFNLLELDQGFLLIDVTEGVVAHGRNENTAIANYARLMFKNSSFSIAPSAVSLRMGIDLKP